MMESVSDTIAPDKAHQQQDEWPEPDQQNGPPLTPDQLIERHIGLVDDAVAYWRRRMPPWADFALVRSGAHVGLMEAARKYDHARYPDFKRYAWITVLRRIKDDMRRGDIEPKNLRALRKRIAIALAELQEQLGRMPSEQEMATHRGVTLARQLRDKARLLHAVAFVSLDEVLNEADRGATTLHDFIGVEDESVQRMDYAAICAILQQCVSRLPVEFRGVLHQSYYEGMKLAAVGRKRLLSTARMAQLRQQALANLRSLFAKECLKRGIQTSDFSRMRTEDAVILRPSQRIIGLTRRADGAPRTKVARARAKRIALSTLPPQPPAPALRPQILSLAPEINALVTEAQRLADQHDGIHDMRQACAIVQGYASLARLGDTVDIATLERVLVKMRICHQTGFYPKGASMLDQAAELAAGEVEPLPTAA